MNDMNQRVISQLSQLITKLADGKVRVDNFSMSLQDHSYKMTSWEDGITKMYKGPRTRSITFEYTEAK